MSKTLTILEISQKQAYIFSSNKLKDNIQHSDEIARVTSVDYLQDAAGVDISSHIVYTGGGHAILEFEDEDAARKVVQSVTKKVLQDLPDIELFAASVPYDETKKPGDNIKTLIATLEKKKSLRLASFHQGTFGVEKIDRNTGRPVREEDSKVCQQVLQETENGFLLTTNFGDLGGSEEDKNFIAVVHIDGNAMGKRVEEITSEFEVGQWDAYKEKMRRFSEGVDHDFKSAFNEMTSDLESALLTSLASDQHILKALSLQEEGGKYFLPVRRIISEGDDICFVSEGRIGVECAVTFLKKLAGKVNEADGEGYAACAGVALVHAKYPFYRAYELAEELCSNAKRFGVTLGAIVGPEKATETGSKVSAIDWHVEFGEMQDSLEDIRNQYITKDGRCLELRPYIVDGPKEIKEIEPVRDYRNFHKLMLQLIGKEDFYAGGRLKELRSVLKRGETETYNYLRFHRIEGIARDAYQGIYKELETADIGSMRFLERKLFSKTADGETRSLLFDAIEMMDTFLPVDDALNSDNSRAD